MKIYSLFVPALITLALNIGGCGGGSGSTATSQTAVQASTVQGVVAAGDPISGTVYLCDSSTPAKEISAKITDAGEFSFDITGLKAPFILKTVDGLNNNLFSCKSEPGTVNINPLTTLAVAIAVGATDSKSLSTLYDGYKQGTASAITQMQGISNSITNASAHVTSSLQPLLTQYGSETADPLAGPYVVNHQGLDDLFDKIAIAISDGNVSITNKDTTSTVFTASLKDLLTSEKDGSLTTSNIPVPTKYDMPGNAVLTLKVQGTLPQGTSIKHATFSVQLPLGITVVTTPSLESGPAAVNTTIPIGSADGSNSSATLSSTNGMLTITMSSVTGFSTGDFLTVRYTDSSSYLMQKRASTDFVISGAVFFSDIYKSQKLQNLTIVPDSIAFP